MDATLLLVLVLPGVLLVAVLLWAAKRADRILAESLDWPSATALIVESRVNRNSKGGLWPSVAYTYHAGDADRRSTRINFVQENRTLADCRALVERYAAGSHATAWYNPQKPGFAVLERTGQPRALRIAAYVVGGLFLATFVILLVSKGT